MRIKEEKGEKERKTGKRDEEGIIIILKRQGRYT